MSVYNGERYLREAVESILNQTFTDFEFIIIDDGSTDSTWDILAEYATRDRRIVLMRNEENIGLTKSLNRGLRVARGKYIARQDADDISMPERLAKQVSVLDTRPQVVLVGASARQVDETGCPIGKAIRQENPHFNRWRLLFGNYMIHSTTMFRREIALQIGGYDESLPYAQDYDLWSRLCSVGEVTQVQEILVEYRKHQARISAAHWDSQLLAAERTMRQLIENLLGHPVSSKEIHWLRTWTRSPLASRKEIEITSSLLLKIWRACENQWSLDTVGRRLIREDLVRHLLSASIAQSKISLRCSGVLLIKSVWLDARLLARRSFWFAWIRVGRKMLGALKV